MERASSEPPREGGFAPCNPFHSKNVQLAYQVDALRPRGLPEHTPGSDAQQPLRDDRTTMGQCVGKGRGGGQTSGRAPCFSTPPSKPLGRDEAGMRKSEGRMPEDVETKKSMGSLGSSSDVRDPDPDGLQRALEIEVVAQLREQNAKLLEELEAYRQLKSSPNSGDGSTQSWVEIRDVRDGDGVDRQGCKTPRNTVNVGSSVRYTPNGTQVPTGTPPTDERPDPPAHEAVPPVPPFPTGVTDDTMKFLDGYEHHHESSHVRVVDKPWKPGCEGPKEPSAAEARNFWLEREVQSLRSALANVSHGNSFRKSEYWNGGYKRVDAGVSSEQKGSYRPVDWKNATVPVDLGRVNPDLAEAISRAVPGDVCHQDRAGSSRNLQGKDSPGHLLGGSGEVFDQDRACTHGSTRPEVSPGNLRGGGGDLFAQARAWQDGHGVCHDTRA